MWLPLIIHLQLKHQSVGEALSVHSCLDAFDGFAVLFQQPTTTREGEGEGERGKEGGVGKGEEEVKRKTTTSNSSLLNEL